MNLAYNTDNKRYFEITEQEKRDMLLVGGSMDKLKQMRIKKYGSIEPLSPDVLNEASPAQPAAGKRTVAKIKQEIESDILFY